MMKLIALTFAALLVTAIVAEAQQTTCTYGKDYWGRTTVTCR